MNLEDLGWSVYSTGDLHQYHCDGYSVGRISLEHKNSYIVITEQGEVPAVLTGRMYFDADGRQDLPVVGDWVAVTLLDEADPHAVIHRILPRRSKFSRKVAGGRVEEQLVAANIDTVFIVVGLDHNFSARRIERYLTLAWESGADPVIVLSKADICDDLPGRLADARASAGEAPVHAVSVVSGDGLDALRSYLGRGRTVAFLGSSGVGKSTIINYLLGSQTQRVQAVRTADSRGRHTTTHRQMFLLPSGGLVIDTPGMRELQLWNADDGLAGTFSDIEDVARQCRYSDCSHTDEPGCRVQELLLSGGLDRARFDNYLKMQKELRYLERKQDLGAEHADRMKWKKIHKSMRHFKKG